MLYRQRLYVCIIWETAHHRTTFGIFCNFTQKTIPEKIAANVPYFFTDCTFSYGKVKGIFGDKDQISSQRTKGRGIGEKPKMRCFVFAKFPLLSKMQTLSHKLLVRQNSNNHHCNWPAQKPK